MADTNTNPELVTYPIPGNDDAIKSLELIAQVLKEAVKEGLEEAQKKSDETERAKEEEKKEEKSPDAKEIGTLTHKKAEDVGEKKESKE